MSIRDPIPRAELGTRFTHLGWFAFCPVYIGKPEGYAPVLHERNGVPSIVFDLAGHFMAACMTLATWFDPHHEPRFMINITGAIERR